MQYLALIHTDEEAWGALSESELGAVMEQYTAFSHEFHNSGIGFEDTLTGKVLDFRGEVARVIHRAVDLKTVALTHYEVIVPVAGCGVYTASACLAGSSFLSCLSDTQFDFGVSLTSQGYVFSHHQERRAIKPGMTAFEPIELDAVKSRQHSGRDPIPTRIAFTQIAFGGHGLEQFTGDDINLIAMLERHVLKVGMYSDAEVGGKCPGRRCPDQHEHFATCQCRID